MVIFTKKEIAVFVQCEICLFVYILLLFEDLDERSPFKSPSPIALRIKDKGDTLLHSFLLRLVLVDGVNSYGSLAHETSQTTVSLRLEDERDL